MDVRNENCIKQNEMEKLVFGVMFRKELRLSWKKKKEEEIHLQNINR